MLTTDSRMERVNDEGAGGGHAGGPAEEAAREPGGDKPGGGRRWRRIAGRACTVAAFLFVLAALVAPAELTRLTPAAFARIPVEGIAGVALILVVPARARRYVAGAAGALLGLLLVLKVMDIGFEAVMFRPFDLVLDWPLLGPAVEFVEKSSGRTGAIGVLVLAAVLAAAVAVLMSLSALRLARAAARHRRTSVRAAAALGTVWVLCAALGVQAADGLPVASRSTAVLAYDHTVQVRASLNDGEEFAEAAAVDAFRGTPPDRLLTGLRGKDVVLAFVESYGRSALEHPEYAAQVGGVLDAGTRRLDEAGFSARSGWLTSPTTGGGSWLAHATLLSGLWVDNEQRYRTLVNSDRFTLNQAFQRAGSRTVALMPAITRTWPEGGFFGYDKVYDSRNIGYRGPRFAFATMPDQYTLSVLQRNELAAGDRAPVMAEAALVSSHAPWAAIPRQVPWDQVGDGSVFQGMGKGDDAPWPPPDEIRGEYRKSIEYTLNTLISYVETYGDDDTVLVFLGDHQPSPVLAGQGASRDVPITVVAKDEAVLAKISGWGWQDGLKPAKNGPVWPMHAFRDRFLTAFGG
ncbi:sulfatase-like hydrolase/transferase [Actinomadura sp. 7K534]|uniref:sulfatase-like hydrolase/transferase n=1 Tax=Actinomadura sp. 7K534 TaxID=2530366 RepID=UPI001A9FC6C6|nr:sulfatase-like hydrolase/transferase [Actinomadura sp. 7K534]